MKQAEEARTSANRFSPAPNTEMKGDSSSQEGTKQLAMTTPTHTEEREPGDLRSERQNATLFCKVPDICRLLGFAGTTQLCCRYLRSD